MEVLMSEYEIINVIDANRCQMDKEQCLLWVWHADKIPPHLGVSVNGRYFSLKANGKDHSIDVDSVIQLINKKKIKTLCFAIERTISLRDLDESFSEFETTIPYKVTCLKPIQNVLNLQDANQLVDLLALLGNGGEIKEVFGYHIPESFNSISKYTVEDINARLIKLNNNA